LRTEDDKVCYGINSVKFAIENMAVATLLISDHLFRAKNVGVRREYVKLSENAEKNGIKVIVFSSMNPTG
jgi:protein pelota